MSSLISPYGGRLVDLLVPAEEAASAKREAAGLPAVVLGDRARLDLEMLATGAFSPLTTFLGEPDYLSVLERGRLANGTVWTIPITLPLPEAPNVKPGEAIALRSSRQELLAILELSEVYPWDRRREMTAVLGKWDDAHPLVLESASWAPRYGTGRLRVLPLPKPADFASLRRTPSEVRALLGAMDAPAVVAFQTRNPLHRSHEELLRRAQETTGGALLVHPVVGLTKPGDVDHVTRVRCYRALVEAYLDPSRTLLSLLPLAMRMAGPREAVWHAIVRRNFGASHFVVGRDHAGPGNDSTGKPFFGPYEARDRVLAAAPEIGVTPVTFDEMVYLPDEGRYEESTKVPAGVRVANLSGTAVRDLLAKGEALPEWFSRPEVAAILADAEKPTHRQGFCVWFTGLSGAGKSATADALTTLLLERGRTVTLLDGDVVRTHLSKGLGFSQEDRETNIRRIGFVASEVVRHGGVAVCAAISPHRHVREEVRALVGRHRFFEVFVDTPLAVCETRDEKGLYRLAREGKIAVFTGVTDPYEAPERAEITLSTTGPTVEENARTILSLLEARGFVRT